MGKEEFTEDELAELTKARKPSTQKELTRKVKQYLQEKAEEANGGPLKKKDS